MKNKELYLLNFVPGFFNRLTDNHRLILYHLFPHLQPVHLVILPALIDIFRAQRIT